MSGCQHVSKVTKWGLNEKYDSVPVAYGCMNCDAISDKPFIYIEAPSEHYGHTTYIEGCFACKVITLELSTGDAGRSESMSNKKWVGELDAYADARSQGIQPAGTTLKAVNEAKAASDKLGVAYNAESMPAASQITKRTATVMKETGAI